MRLCASSLAWPPTSDVTVAAVLREEGLRAVEVAPTKVHPRPLEADERAWREYRRSWEGEGLSIVALQAILFGRPDLLIFGDAGVRRATRSYLHGMARVAAWLGARVLVLGSPRNRSRGALTVAEAFDAACEFFDGVGADAASEDVIVCIEPNPPVYGCDFVTTSAEGVALVRAVASPGFGLHLDVAAMTLAGEDVPAALHTAAGKFSHFHASEPHLGPLGEGGVDHDSAATALRETRYGGFVSVEMREAPGREAAQELRRVARLLRTTYGVDGGGR